LDKELVFILAAAIKKDPSTTIGILTADGKLPEE
jgi:hypothetical protein